MISENQFLGIVQNGQFRRLTPQSASGTSVKLTSIPPQAAMIPDELDLTPYEGSAIMVSGYDQGDTIYAAKVVDKAGPILTEVVRQMFTQQS